MNSDCFPWALVILIPYAFLWSQNPMIRLSFSWLLTIADDLSELRGGFPLFLKDMIPIELRKKVGDGIDVEMVITNEVFTVYPIVGFLSRRYTLLRNVLLIALQSSVSLG